jgi:hypothetical protein
MIGINRVETASCRTHPNLALSNSTVFGGTAGYLVRQESFGIAPGQNLTVTELKYPPVSGQ